MTPDGLKSSLGRGEIYPAYFFYGEEDFLIEEAQEKLCAVVLKDGIRDFNLDILYGDEVDGRQVVARANSYPMMAERRVVILKDFHELQERDVVYLYLEKPSPNTVLLLVSPEDDENLHEKTVAVQFRRMRDSDLPSWVSERVGKYEKQINSEAYEVLLAYVEHSLRALDREIEKIAVYVGEKKTIEGDDVRAVVGISKVYNLYELRKAVGNRNLPRSIEIVERMMDFGERPERIIAAMTNHYIDLLKLAEAQKRRMSEQELAKVLHTYPSRVREYLGYLRYSSKADLERSFSYLAAADEKIKFTSESPRSVMTVLLHELLLT